MLVVLFKTISIQFEGGKPVFLTSSDGNEKMPTRTVKRIPRRGQILDVNYTPLVTSVSFYDIHMDPQVVDDELFDSDVPDLCIALNDLYPEKTAREYETIIRDGRKRGSRYILIHKKATNEERKKLKSMPIFREGRLKGGLIDNEEIIIRKMPHGELMRRTLGYVYGDYSLEKGIGLEQAFNEYLRGEAGEEIEQKISNGWKKVGPITKEPVEGANVVTTIDMEIQELAHSELLNQLNNQGAKNGTVIVMDVKTGYVKAIVNLSRGSDGNYYESFNHAIGTKEVPGSTFKLASLMAAIEDGKISIHDKVNAEGVYKFYTSKLEDTHKEGYGMITVQQAFEKSSNVISKVINSAYRKEPQAFIDRLKSFGLAEPLGVEIAGEPIPTMYQPGDNQWSGISLPWMAIGYEVQLTPLQVLAFYNAVANNGTYMKPQFVKEVMRGNQVIKTFAPKVINEKICSQKTLTDLQICLEGVVKRGTGTALQSAYFDIAGKTGTAVILNDDLRYGAKGERKYQASFVGYFPAQDPIYSCIVVVAAPSRDIYGATVSGTVFTAIANKVYASSLKYHEAVNLQNKRRKEMPVSKDGSRFDLINVYRSFKIPYGSTTDADFVNTHTTEKQVEMTKRNSNPSSVPDVKGMTAKDAVYLLESYGLVVRIKGYGRVVKQSITPGMVLHEGVLIELNLE